MEGQLWDAERRFLYDAIITTKPRTILEIGTWKGGGSTLQISNALTDLHRLGYQSGELWTCEIDEGFHNQAKAIFADKPFIHCYLQKSTEFINQLLSQDIVPDFVFFDGSEDPTENLEDFKLLDGRLAVGSHFCMHDWDLGRRADGLESTKAQLLRPYLSGSSAWKILGSLTAPQSVGIVLARKDNAS